MHVSRTDVARNEHRRFIVNRSWVLIHDHSLKGVRRAFAPLRGRLDVCTINLMSPYVLQVCSSLRATSTRQRLDRGCEIQAKSTNEQAETSSF